MSSVKRPPALGSSSAYSPIQRTIASGRVKYSYTRAGEAWMNTEAATGSVGIGLVGFDRLPEVFEVLRPELREVFAQ